MERRAFLERVGSRSMHRIPPPPIPQDWPVEVTDPVGRFACEQEAVGGMVHRAGPAEGADVLAKILAHRVTPTVLVTREDGIPPGVEKSVEGTGGRLLRWPEASREEVAGCDVGVTAAVAAAAETGSIVVYSRPPGGRAPSLVPSVHVAFLPVERILATTRDLFRWIGDRELPSNIVVITGPSKSADIGNELVMGVHGPGELHVIVLGDR